jgi:isopenicillin N synthase-like dioxygenase
MHLVSNIQHFVPESTVTSAVNAAKDFFALPDDEKLAVKHIFAEKLRYMQVY